MDRLLEIGTMYRGLYEQHPLLFTFTTGVLGLLIGSFLNVAALRLPKGESIVHPPSHCVHCNHRLAPLDLIPIISWLIMRGRCRYCKGPVSAFYPIGEALTGAAYAVIGWHFGVSLETLIMLVLVSVLVAVSMSDYKTMLIPDLIVWPAFGTLLLLRIFIHPMPFWQYVSGAVIGYGTLYLIAWLSIRFLGKEGMGGGDIKLFAVIGMALGMKLTLLTLFAASFLGTLFGVISIMLKLRNREDPMPFAPFISCGAFLCLLWGDEFIQWYVSMFLGAG